MPAPPWPQNSAGFWWREVAAEDGQIKEDASDPGNACRPPAFRPARAEPPGLGRARRRGGLSHPPKPPDARPAEVKCQSQLSQGGPRCPGNPALLSSPKHHILSFIFSTYTHVVRTFFRV